MDFYCMTEGEFKCRQLGFIRANERAWLPQRLVASMIYNANRGKHSPVMTPEKMVPTSFDVDKSMNEALQSDEYKEKMAKFREIIKERHG